MLDRLCVLRTSWHWDDKRCTLKVSSQRRSWCWTRLLTWKGTDVVVWRMIKEGVRELKPHLRSHLHTPGQSLRKVDMIDTFAISESYKNWQTQTPHFCCWKDVGRGGEWHFLWSILRSLVLLLQIERDVALPTHHLVSTIGKKLRVAIPSRHQTAITDSRMSLWPQKEPI